MIDLTRLETLEPLTWRAPSAHNTQPWKLAYSAEVIRLSYDPARALAVSDTDRRDLLLSLGAFVEAMLIVAADHKVPLAFEARIDFERCQVGCFRAASELYDGSFTTADVLARHTSRLPYAGDALDPAVVSELRSTLREKITLHVIDPRDLGPLMTAANAALFGSPETVSELRRWLRLTGRAQLFANDGLSAQCLNLNRLQALGVALALSRPIHPLLCGLGLHRLLARQAAEILRSTPSVLALSQRVGNALDVLRAGRELLRIWLQLARRGYSAHPLSEIIDDRATCRALTSMLRLDDNDRILSVFRVGRSMPPPRSRRLR